MKINATLISHYCNGIERTEDYRMKTFGDRIEQLLRDFGRARYEGAPPYTQVELTDMLTGKRPGPDGKFYKVDTNKSTINRIIQRGKEPSFEVLFAICDLFNTDTEWILRGNVLEPEKIPDKFNTDEANEVGAMVDKMQPQTRQMMLTGAQSALRWEKALLQIQQDKLMESQRKVARLLEENINLWSSADRKIADDYIENIGHHRTGPQ